MGEIARILAQNGDKQARIRMTLARGIIGVNTSLNARLVVRLLPAILKNDPSAIQCAFKWVPIDLWTSSDLEAIKAGVTGLKNSVEPNETWRMTVEMRRYTALHKIEIIREIAEIFDQKVILENPDKNVRIEILGNQAGISVLRPQEEFSIAKTPAP